MPLMGQLALTFQDQITQKHNEGVALDQQLLDTLLLKLEAARATGVLLESAEKDLNAAEWRELKAKLPFDSQALKSYLAFSRKNPQPITDVRVALQAVELAARSTGLLPFSEERGQQFLVEPNFFSHVVRFAMRFGVEWRRFIARKPIDEWHVEQAEQFLDSLRPFMCAHKAVKLSLTKRQ